LDQIAIEIINGLRDWAIQKPR